MIYWSLMGIPSAGYRARFHPHTGTGLLPVWYKISATCGYWASYVPKSEPPAPLLPVPPILTNNIAVAILTKVQTKLNAAHILATSCGSRVTLLYTPDASMIVVVVVAVDVMVEILYTTTELQLNKQLLLLQLSQLVSELNYLFRWSFFLFFFLFFPFILFQIRNGIVSCRFNHMHDLAVGSMKRQLHAGCFRFCNAFIGSCRFKTSQQHQSRFIKRTPHTAKIPLEIQNKSLM